MRRFRVVVAVVAAGSLAVLTGHAGAASLTPRSRWQSTGENSCRYTSWYAQSGTNLRPGPVTVGVEEYCSTPTAMSVSLAVGSLTKVRNGSLYSRYLYADASTELSLVAHLPAATAGKVYTVGSEADSASNCEEGPCSAPPPPPVRPHQGQRVGDPAGQECTNGHPDPQIDTWCTYQFVIVGTGTA
jgi:hypothetical protein